MGFLHGTELLTEFTNDQITHRVNRNILGILQDFMKVLLLLLVGLLPWWGWLREAIVANWRQFGPLSFLRNPEWLLVTIWIAVYLGLAALVDRVNFRYLTPIIPLVALSAAGLMAELSADRRGVWCRRLGWSGVIVVTLFTLLATGISLEFGKTVSLGIALAIAAGIWIVVCVVILVRPSAWQPVSVYSTLCILLLASISYVTIYSVSRQTLGERLWQQLEKMEVGDRSIAFATKPCYPARLRVVSGGQSQTHWLGFELPESMGKVERLKHDVLVLNTEDAVGIDRSQFEVISIADGFQKIDTGDLCRAALAGQLSEYVDAKRGEIWLAIKRQPELQSDQRPERIANNPVDAVNF
jgi:hypothetical protein